MSLGSINTVFSLEIIVKVCHNEQDNLKEWKYPWKDAYFVKKEKGGHGKVLENKPPSL